MLARRPTLRLLHETQRYCPLRDRSVTERDSADLFLPCNTCFTPGCREQDFQGDYANRFSNPSLCGRRSLGAVTQRFSERLLRPDDQNRKSIQNERGSRRITFWEPKSLEHAAVYDSQFLCRCWFLGRVSKCGVGVARS